MQKNCSKSFWVGDSSMYIMFYMQTSLGVFDMLDFKDDLEKYHLQEALYVKMKYMKFIL